MSELAITQQIQKLLIDSKNEVKQRGAQEVAAKALTVFRDVSPEEAYAIVTRTLHSVEKSYLKTSVAAYRRGGLICLRAIIGSVPMRQQPDSFVQYLGTLIFNCFTDVDASVRLAAVEASHEMVRRFQTQVLSVSFREMFLALLCGLRDKDKRVVVLVREVSATLQELVTGNEAYQFDVESFVKFVTETLDPLVSRKLTNEADVAVVQWLVEWINHIYYLPRHKLVLQLSRLLGPLFRLSACSRTVEVEKLLGRSLKDVKREYAEGKEDLHLPELLITASHCVSTIDNAPTRKLALEWIQELLLLGPVALLQHAHVVTETVIPQLGSRDLEIRLAAQNVNNQLHRLILAQKDSNVSGVIESIHLSSVLQTAMHNIEGKGSEEARVAALEWVTLVQFISPEIVSSNFESTLAGVLMTVCDSSENVVHRGIETLCIISGDDGFNYFLRQLLTLFQDRAALLLPKVPMIIKQMQLRYQGEELESCEKLLLEISSILPHMEDKRFVEKCVVTLSTMLLTSKELMPVRDILRRGVTDERARVTFLGLYDCWCCNFVATLALCLLSAAYSHAFRLISLLGTAEVSASTLVQLDRLAQLIESPVFTFLRLAMLKPTENLPLIKTLFGLQMMLPQSSPQYRSLHNRLKTIPSLVQLEREADHLAAAASATTRKQATKGKSESIDWDALMEKCEHTQRSIETFERQLALQRLGERFL